MKITETNKKGLTHTFKVVVPADEFEAEVQKRLQDIATKVKLPGFRPGKVPMNVVEQKYGQAVKGEAAEALVQQGSRQAFEENKLKAANTPKVDIGAFEDGKDFEFTVEAEVLPEIKPVDLTKVEVQKLTAEVTQKEIDEALKRLAQSRRETEVLNEDRPTKTGDIIVIDFVGSIDGKEFKGGKGKDYYLELGSNTFIPGFEDQLTGKKIGEKTLVNVAFPANYHVKELAGKQALFDVDIKELRKVKDVEMNDDFAKLFGKDTLDALKELVKDELAKEYANVSHIHLKRAILDALAPLCDFEAPQSMVDMEFDAIWKQYEAAKARGELDEDEKNAKEEDLKKEYKGIAERRVKLGLLLAEIANLNKITLSQDDLTKAIMAEARRYPGQEQKVFDFYAKNERALDTLRAPLFEEKVIDFVADNIKVNEKQLTVAELYAYDPDAKDNKKNK